MLKQVRNEELIVSFHYFRSLLKSISLNVCIIYFVHSFIFIPAFHRGTTRDSSSRWMQNTSQSTAISGDSADSTLRRDQARLEMDSLRLVLEQALGRFFVGLASRPCLASRLWGILATWPNQRGWDLSIRRNGWTFRTQAQRISHLRTLSRSFTPWTLRKSPISAACTWDNSFSVITQDSWP